MILSILSIDAYFPLTELQNSLSELACGKRKIVMFSISNVFNFEVSTLDVPSEESFHLIESIFEEDDFSSDFFMILLFIFG